MKTSERIYDFLIKAKAPRSVGEIVDSTNIERTYTSKLLGNLEKEGKISSEKTGRKVFYSANTKKIYYNENLRLKNLSETDVWLQFNQKLSKVSEECQDIFQFTFTEILNNAIDHSRSDTAFVEVWSENGNLSFVIRDYGIGIFKNIRLAKNLSSDYEAVFELVKGKLTTDPKYHSGEGVFWTSKVADKIIIESGDIRLVQDNLLGKYATEKIDEPILGTKVLFKIETKTKKSIYKLFHSYSFDKEKVNLDTTVLPIELYQDGSNAWISRSQAKKILSGLEKFKKIIFDFRDIKMIGQGFSDEMFRVWQIQHPDIIIEAINTSEPVKLMIEKAKSDQTGRD